MGSVKIAVDHDSFVEKNRRMATADSFQRRDRDLEKKGFSQTRRAQEASCFNCKFKPKCPEFRKKRTGSTNGAASFGGDERLYCDKYQPVPANESRSMSKKQIKSLLKNVKRKL
ncbi:MAG: hypothetical protein GF398_13515 [Chitinivibrionales bacterium]|nr:hypothetical protein [Chitinivibrionales bacterium]